VERTVELLRELGHDVVEAAPPVRRKAFMRAYLTLVAGETAADLDEGAELLGHKIPARDVELGTRILQVIGQKISAADFNKALRHLQRLTREMAGFLTRYDLLLTPTLARPPAVIGALAPTPVEAGILRTLGALKAGNMMK